MSHDADTRAWLDRYGDEDALAALRAEGERALPALRRACRALEPGDLVTAEWQDRILVAVAADPAREALPLLGRVNTPEALAWIFRRTACQRNRS